MGCSVPNETWLPIVGYEGYYEVSDQGQVRSLDRLVNRGPCGFILKRGVVLRQKKRGLSESGPKYASVCLKVHGQSKTFSVHRLVLQAFVGPCPRGQEGCHNNGQSLDNRLSNLRWDTRSSNILDTVKHGGHSKSSRTHCHRGHEYTPQNTGRRRSNNARICRACDREKHRVIRGKGAVLEVAS